MLLAVDTGGTKTLVAGFAEDGTISRSVKFPTPRDQAAYIEQLVQSIHEVAQTATIDAIVVALPGIIKNDIAVWCNHLHWQDFDLKTPLSKKFPGIPILIENDANLGGLGETRMLAVLPASSLYVTVSTGIGTGVITDGHIDPGLRLSEGGRSLVEFDGLIREWESFASGSAIFKAYGKNGEDITSKRTWHQIADRISRGFLALVPMIQPDVIIIGGGVGTHFSKFGDTLVAILTEKLPPHIPCPTFIKASHPEQAVIYGCYYYAIDTLADKNA